MINISVISTNVTVALFHEDGSLVHSVQLDKSVLVYKWTNLNPATNYTVQIIAAVRDESRILATTWALTSKENLVYLTTFYEGKQISETIFVKYHSQVLICIHY